MKRRKKRYDKHFHFKVKCLSIIIVFIIVSIGFYIDDILRIFAEDPQQEVQASSILPDIKVMPTPTQLEGIYSSHGILINMETNQVIAQSRIYEKIFPASLTKIMTAILAIENAPDMAENIVIPSDIFLEIYLQNAATAGFLPDETVTVEDLIYGLMLASGAECSLTIERVISDAESNFVALMNEKAKDIGMFNTSFTNSTGLHDNDHFTTIEDISILLKYALQNDMFRNVFTTSSYTTSPSAQHPEGFTLHSTMFKRMESNSVNSGTIIGGKTGYTKSAGLCLASVASVDENEYMLITVNAEGSPSTEPFHILDAFAVYNRIIEQ